MSDRRRIRAITKAGILFGACECYVLEDGRRVLSQRGIVRALTAKDGGKAAGLEKGNLGQYLGSLPKRFAYLATDSDVEIARQEGGTAIGRDARWFVDLLNAYVDAFFAGELHASQAHLAANARRLLAAAATIGIEALVDEATGYEPAPDDTRMTRFLKELFREDPRKWERFWPEDVINEFCRTFRIRKTQAFPAPLLGVIGKLYETRFGSEQHAELKRINPSGPDRNMHHQHFSDRLLGVMSGDMAAVRALLLVSASKEQFWELWTGYCTGRAQLRLAW